VVREDGRVEHNLLQKFNELVGQISRHEGLDGDRDVVRVLGLRQRSLDDLVNERAPEFVRLNQHLGPEVGVAALDQVARKGLEQRVLVANGDQLLVALAALVGDASQVRVPLLAVLANDA
jgi:hypothetical protein